MGESQSSGELDITKPSQRALIAWANLIQEQSPSLGHVTSVEVQSAFDEVRRVQSPEYVRVFYLTPDGSQWDDDYLWHDDVEHMATFIKTKRRNPASLSRRPKAR